MSEEKTEYQKPLPDFRPETKPFWDGTKEHKLLLPKCKETGQVFFYPRAISPFPGSVNMDFDWVESTAKVKSGPTLCTTWGQQGRIKARLTWWH